jgi:hypothetical protein
MDNVQKHNMCNDEGSFFLRNVGTYKICHIPEHRYLNVGPEVITEVVTKSSIFWDITPLVRCKSINVSEGHIASTFRVEEQAQQETQRETR